MYYNSYDTDVCITGEVNDSSDPSLSSSSCDSVFNSDMICNGTSSNDDGVSVEDVCVVEWKLECAVSGSVTLALLVVIGLTIMAVCIYRYVKCISISYCHIYYQISNCQISNCQISNCHILAWFMCMGDYQ